MSITSRGSGSEIFQVCRKGQKSGFCPEIFDLEVPDGHRPLSGRGAGLVRAAKHVCMCPGAASPLGTSPFSSASLHQSRSGAVLCPVVKTITVKQQQQPELGFFFFFTATDTVGHSVPHPQFIPPISSSYSPLLVQPCEWALFSSSAPEL